jgi:GT2 family glycosyltransferase
LKDCKIEYFQKPEARISELRNFGASQAKGEVLGFIDSDCQVEADWMKCALAHLAGPKAGVVGSNYDIPDNPHWIERAWSTASDQIVKQVRFVPAGNMTVRREVYERINGFDDTLETGEDTDLCTRVIENGYTVIADPRIRSIHWGNPKTLLGFIEKEIWYGKGMVRLLRERNFSDKVLLLTNIFILTHVAILTVPFLPLTVNTRLMAIFGLGSLILCMSALSAWYRCRKLNYYRHILSLTFIWYFYFLGRAISMICIYWDLALRKGKTLVQHNE